jgi:predicted acylesterase/phospholipase RssA
MDPLSQLRSAKKIGVLFCGGASRCAFQVGVFETLDALGIKPAICLGVSGGAWNAAAVSAGSIHRLRAYWRFFCRMPSVDLSNLMREHSPFIWRRLHERAFKRYIQTERLRSPEAIPLFIALTRLRDRRCVTFDMRAVDDPLEVLLASNYLPPFYTHAPVIDGERYGDAGFSDNLPYALLFEQGCDAVIVISQKGQCEGGLFRNLDEPDHVIPEPFREHTVVIRPKHPLDVSFTERRWRVLSPVADQGGARAREILLGEPSQEPVECRHGVSTTLYFSRLRHMARRWIPTGSSAAPR